MATHDIAIDDRGIVEAFPSSFMGVMLEDPKALNARRGDRSDTFFRYSAARGAFHDLVQHPLLGRSLASDPSTILNHDDRAGVVCALTALCVTATEFTAVGDHDGWIILPPPSFVQPWAIDFLRANAAGEAAQAFYTTQAAPGA
jgi:hypothetical protein